MQHLSINILEKLALSAVDIVDGLEQLMRAQSGVYAAPKAAISTSDERYLMATLSAMDEPPLMAVKALVVNQANAEQDLASINATVILLNSRTGLPVATVDGNWITAVRTAAASAVAARKLARPDAQVMAFVGSGVQARSHLSLFADLFPLQQVRLLGRGKKNREALMADAHELDLDAIDCEGAQEAVTSADIVASSLPVTLQVEPFIDAAWLKPGVFVSSIDLAIPWMPSSLYKFDQIIIDDAEQEAAMPTPMLDPSLVKGDLKGLLAGSIKGRENDQQRTAFVFRAVPLGDLALAVLAYQTAVKRGLLSAS